MKTKYSFDSRALTRALSAIIPVAAGAVLWVAPGHARAASIGVNFSYGGSEVLAATGQAGVGDFAQTHYNNVTGTASGLALNDDDGAATTATLTTNGTILFSAITGAPSGPDEILNDSCANPLSATSWSFSVANVPYASYSIVVYDLQDNVGAELGIGIGTTTFYTSSPLYYAAGYVDHNTGTPYIYTPGVSIVSTAPTPLSDYVIFTGLSGGSQTVTMTGFNGGGERIGGFQIVQTAVPEPSTWAVLLGGLGLLGGAQRLRRKRQA